MAFCGEKVEWKGQHEVLNVGSFILSERKAQERYKSVQEVCDVGKKNEMMCTAPLWCDVAAWFDITNRSQQTRMD